MDHADLANKSINLGKQQLDHDPLICEKNDWHSWFRLTMLLEGVWRLVSYTMPLAGFLFLPGVKILKIKF